MKRNGSSNLVLISDLEVLSLWMESLPLQTPVISGGPTIGVHQQSSKSARLSALENTLSKSTEVRVAAMALSMLDSREALANSNL